MIAAPAQHKVELLKRRTVSETLAATFGVFQQIGWKILGIAAATAGPPILISTAAIGYWALQFFFLFSRNPFAYRVPIDPPIALIVLGLLCSLASIVLFCTALACTLHIYDSLGPEAVTLRRVWEEMRRHLMAVLGQFLLLGLMGFGIFIPLTMLAATMGPGSVVLLFPLICFMVGWFSSTYITLVPIRVVEHAKVFDSFRRAMQLARGRRWNTFGLLFLAGLFGTLLRAGFSLPYSLFSAIDDTFSRRSSMAGGVQWELIILLVLLALGLFVGNLYTTVAAYVHYYNLAERTDHWRLMERIQALRPNSGDLQPDEVARA